jgi:hypothetical protein
MSLCEDGVTEKYSVNKKKTTKKKYEVYRDKMMGRLKGFKLYKASEKNMKRRISL